MDFSESLALKCLHDTAKHIFINEGNIKVKRLNRNIRLGNSFQYTYKDLSHRFITWRIVNNNVKITEYSSEYELLGHQIEITFDKSQILGLNIFENEQTVEFLISTSLIVLRFSLHHPSKLRQPNKDSQQYSVFYGVNELNEVKHAIVQYFDVTNIASTSSIIDRENNDAHFHYALSNGSIACFTVASSPNIENMTYFEMNEASLLSKIFYGFMQRQRSIEYPDISILDMTYVDIFNKFYLVTISRDNRLRIWNLKDKSCVASEDLLTFVLESNNCNRSILTINHSSIISSHKIKSFFIDTNIDEYTDTVVVYFHTIFGKDTLSNWIVLRINDPTDKASYNKPIEICSNINNAGDNLNLLDYAIGYDMKSKDIIGVWSLMSQSDTDRNFTHSLNWVPLIEDKNRIKVKCRIYNSSNELDLFVLEHQDPQESIMIKIFSHYFSRISVINALNRYNSDGGYLPINSNIDELKYRLVMVVEAEVEKKLAIYIEENTDIDVIELNRQQWYKIFQEIVEEHFSIMEPLGIISASGTIGLNRLDTVSLMRRACVMEQILSGSSNEHLKDFYDINTLIPGSALLRYIHELSLLLQSIDSWPLIEHRLFTIGESPKEICRQLSLPSFDISSLNSRFDNQPLLLDQTVNLLEKVDMDSFYEITSDLESCRLSSLSLGMLHYSTCQVVKDRICAFVALMTMLTPRSLNSPHGSHLSNLIERIVGNIKSLISVHWLLTVIQRTSPELTDVQKNQLNSVSLLENRCENDDSTDIFCMRGLQLLQNKFKVNKCRSHNWQSKMREGMVMIVNHLNPRNDSFPLAQICKYFLSYNMPLELIDYLKMITKSEPKGWWNGDECLVNFMIGLAYMLLNKPWKSVEHILESFQKPDISSSLLPDVILNDDVISGIDCLSVLQSVLFIKIIEVIENVDNPHAYTITLARSGINLINDSMEANENIAKYKSILMTILFKNLLEIQKYDEARLAIINNPDIDKQKDCLRQFIVVLCDKCHLRELVNFDYGHLNEEFINIVSSRARASDLSTQNDPFYNVLYSFQILHGDVKSAATCMLELALRLDNDMKNQSLYLDNRSAIERLQRQVKAYLTCITASNLLPKEEQLFVFPTTLIEDFIDSNMRNFNSVDNEMDVCEDAPIEEVVYRNIINLNHIRRQYDLIKSRLKILKESPEHGFIQNSKLTPALTLASLLQMGLYSDAIHICCEFKLDMGSVVNTITTRCAQIYKNCLDRPILKEKENVIDTLEEIVKNRDFASFGSLQKLMWKLLSEVLQRYDSSVNGDLYIKACSKLLSSGIEQLPTWLVDAVIAKNSYSSLLKLYITNSYIEPAVNLACRVLTDRIDEICLLKEEMGYCGAKNLLKSQMKWFSYPIILHLLKMLAQIKDQQYEATELFERLNDKFRTMTNVLQIDAGTKAIVSM